jgi:PleD family two-component response regulator
MGSGKKLQKDTARPLPRTMEELYAFVIENSTRPELIRDAFDAVEHRLMKREEVHHLLVEKEKAMLDILKGSVERRKEIIAEYQQKLDRRNLVIKGLRQTAHRLISEKYQAKQEAAQANEEKRYDPRTKLLHGPFFLEDLRAAISTQQRGRWLVVGIMDFGDFSEINDPPGPGHSVGDRVLTIVSDILKAKIRPGSGSSGEIGWG